MTLQTHPSQSPLRRAAFTLMEMLVVVAIIVVLASLGGFFFLNQLGHAKKSAAITHMKTTLTTAAETYQLNNDDPPPTLEVLLGQDPSGKGPYLKSADAIRTPWPTLGNGIYVIDYEKSKATGQPHIYCQSPWGTLSNIKEESVP